MSQAHFLYQLFIFYCFPLHFFDLFNNKKDYGRKRNALGVGDSWDRRCWPLQEELTRARYGYAMTPFPNLGGLDLAGLFMDRKKFITTGVYFSTSNFVVSYWCICALLLFC